MADAVNHAPAGYAICDSKQKVRDADNAEAVMALACLENSRQWEDYWPNSDPTRNWGRHDILPDSERGTHLLLLFFPRRFSLPAMNTTSASLLERLKRPDDQLAWERFVRLYTPLIYGWGSRAGLGADEAADLVQEVFAILLQKMPEFQYDPKKSFRAWLKTVTLNRWRDVLRRRRHEPVPAGDRKFPDPAGPDVARWFEETEYRHHLVRCAMRLIRTDFEETTWQACWLYVAEGRPAAEVADKLGVTVNSVYLAKSRVLRRLREELKGLLD